MPELRRPGGLILPEQTAPGTPATGTAVLYFLSDNHLYWKDEAGSVHGVIDEVAGLIGLTNSTSNIIDFGTAGNAPPAFSARSAGTKLVLYNSLSGTVFDYAIGIENLNMWHSVGSGGGYKWYKGGGSVSTSMMVLHTDGQLQLPIQGSTGGLLIGGDASLYRSGAGALTTNSHLVLGSAGSPTNLYANGGVYAGNGTYARVVLDGATSAISFSDGTNTWDATLFRLAADALSIGLNDIFSLSRAGGTHPADPSSALGDKIPMWGTGLDALRYGFGVQSGALVAYVGTGGYFKVSAAAASGQASTGAAGILMSATGTVILAEQAAPATPPAGYASLYVKTDGRLYVKDDTGTETDLNAGGGSAPALNVSTKTSAYTVTTANDVILADATTAPFTITLPTAVGWTKPLYIKRTNAGANNVTIDAAGTETIDGDQTAVLVARYAAITLISDGANWSVF